jgi:hypothetical protein
VTFQSAVGSLIAQTSIIQLGTTNTSAFTGVISPSWNIGNTYPLGTIVVNNKSLYQANSLINAGTSFTTGTSGSTWSQVSGVPNWTTLGTIQSVGISAAATSPTIPVSPTLPSNTTINTIMYKQLGPKTHSVRGSIGVPSTTLTGNNVGTGDYLFTLPNGLQFDTSVVGQTIYTGDTLANSSLLLMKVIPGSYASANNTTTYTQGWSVGIVPYSATQYRVVLPVYGSGVRCFGSIWFQLVNNQLEEIDWQFDFQSL